METPNCTMNMTMSIFTKLMEDPEAANVRTYGIGGLPGDE
jgi:hypothetical protein